MAPRPSRSTSTILLAALVALLHAPGLLLVPPTARAATVIYVAPTSAGDASGDSWANAASLQAALGRASSGDEIWVKAGTYLPGTARTATFNLPDGVALYGGFAGDEAAVDQREPAAGRSILSGDIGAPGDRADNVYHVVTGIGIGQQTRLDGFTVAGGNADLVGPGFTHVGGGIYLADASPTIRNVVLRDNYADYGGGLGVRAGSPQLSDLAFLSNAALNGGGASLSGSNATISSATFLGNTGEYGGGVYLENPGAANLSQVLFSGNTATLAGGALALYDSLLTLSQATLTGNRAPLGPAVAASASPALTVRNSILWGNGPDPIQGAPGPPDVQFSLVEGGYAGAGNRSADPSFVDARGPDGIAGTADDNARLAPGSPAIDGGSNAAIPADSADRDGDADRAEGIPSDLDGRQRISNAIVDLGAYEYQASASPTATTSPTTTATTGPTPPATPTPTITYAAFLPVLAR